MRFARLLLALRRSFPFLLLWFVLDLAAQETIGSAINQVQMHSADVLPWIAFLASLQLIAELVLSGIWATGVARNLIARDKGLSIKEHLQAINQLAIENLRAMAAIVRVLPLFIFPALFRFVRFSLVNYVVLFHHQYSAGKVDALEASRSLTRGFFFYLAAALLFFGPIWALAKFLTFGSEVMVFDSPAKAFGLQFLDVGVNLVASYAFLALYQKAESRQIGQEKK